MKIIANETNVDVSSYKDWLSQHSQNRFVPQPYEQLAAVLQNSGNSNASREILVEKERQYARLSELAVSEWIWYRILGPLIDYGYRPWKALWLAFFIIILGVIVFGLGSRGEIEDWVMTPTSADALDQKRDS